MIYLSEDQISEVTRCVQDVSYFIETFCWLEEKETQRVLPFIPFPYQRQMLDWMMNGGNVLSLKSRRVGCSWITAAYAAWLMNFHEGVNILFLSKKEEDAKKLLRKVKFILKNLAYHDHENHRQATRTPWLCGEIGTDNQQLFSIIYRDDQGRATAESEAASLSTTSESGRSEGASLIFLDEFAFVKPDDEATWTAIKPTVARGGQWIQVSTPRGVGGVFHRLCMEAERHENKSYEYIKVHWSEAGITQAQYEAAIEGMDAASIAQEWEMEFTQAGNPVFNATDLAACYKPPDEYPEVAEVLKNYHMRENYYYSGADTSEGKAHRKSTQKDYHSWCSLTASGIQAYAEHSKESLSWWAGHTVTTGGNTQINVPGRTTKLHEKYPGLMRVEDNGAGATVVNRHVCPLDGKSELIGSHTDKLSKARYINNLKLAIEGHDIVITDLFTYQCLLVYQNGTLPGTYEAPLGYNDDPVMSLAMANDLRYQYGGLEFPWADGVAPLRRSVSPEEAEAMDLSNLPAAPDLVAMDNMRTSEFMPGPGRMPIPEHMLLPDLSLIVEQPEESQNHRKRDYDNQNVRP